MISIIITAYKESETIKKAIQAVLDNHLKNYEIIVTAPDKETLNAAKEYASKNKNIKLIQDKGEGKPTALNAIFKIAKGDILILTDGDIYIGKNSINHLLEHFNDKKTGAVSGHPVALESKDKMMDYWAHVLLDIAHDIREKRNKQGKFLFCSGYLFAMRKGLVKEIPSSVLDDSYISQIIWQKGYKIKYEPRAAVFIKNPSSLKDWIKQKKRNTFGEFQLKKMKSSSMRGFKEESSGIIKIFSYPKTPKEFFWTIFLVMARLYVWINATFTAKIKKSHMKKVWVRIDSTK